MATNCSDVFDLFMTRVNVYQLTSIYQTSASTLNLHLEPYLLDSINEFLDVSNQDLTYTLTSGSVEGYFTENLDNRNKFMLSFIMTKYWWAYQVRNLLQFQNLLQDHDFKTFSQAQNLQAKQQSYNNIREEVSQAINDYSYRYNDWASWKNQVFDS